MTTKQAVTDDELGKLARKQWELFRRVKEGTLDLGRVEEALQGIIEQKDGEDSAFILARYFTIDRSRDPRERLSVANKRVYLPTFLPQVVNDMPRGEGEEGVIIFFQVGRCVNNKELDREYDLRGLKPADPCSLIQVNEDDPVLSDKYPNVTYWEGGSIVFRHGAVNVQGDPVRWKGWWYAGFCK